MDFYTVWDNNKLLGVMFDVKFSNDKIGTAMYTTDELVYFDDFLKEYNLKLIKNSTTGAFELIDTKSETSISNKNDNSYTRENAPELVLLFMNYKK